MENKDILPRLVECIPKAFHPKNGLITRDMELEADLGITGDDADEFIADFAEKFNVDISKFNPNEYFLAEGEDHLQPLLTWFGKKIKKHDRKRITISCLENAVKKGKLL